MTAVDPRLVGALVEQHATRREMLAAGANHVGWKLGVGERESIGGEMAIGFLTSATSLAPGAAYVASPADEALHADVELFVEFARDVGARRDADAIKAAIGRYGVAVEIVDLTPAPNEPESAVAGNVFHRAVAFGPTAAGWPGDARGSATVNGRAAAAAAAGSDVHEKLARAARLLDAVGENFGASDRVITGSIVQVPVESGDEVVGAIRGIGDVALSLRR